MAGSEQRSKRNEHAFPAAYRRVLLLILVICLSFAPVLGVAAEGAHSGPTSAEASNSVLVRFQPTSLAGIDLSSADKQLIEEAGGGQVLASLEVPGAYRIGLRSGFTAAEVAAALSLDSAVVYAEPDRIIQLDDAVAGYQAETDSGPSNWDLSAIDAQRAWNLGDGTGVVVAVLDTGVSATHPDLAGRVLSGWNVLTNSDNTADDAGHGTYVAGLIGGHDATGAASGVAPGVSILPVKILDSSGTGSTASFVAGINYAVQAGARIINISASGTTDSPAMDDALANAEAHGVLVVASAGNDASEATLYPAATSTVLAVTATDAQNALAGFSSYGPSVDLAAPGVNITSSWWSADKGNSYMTASGSSASAPLVAGAAAIVAELQPGVSAAKLREILTESAKDIAAPGIDAQTGFGLVDAYAAARIAAAPADPAAASLSSVQADNDLHLHLTASGFDAGEPLLIWTDSGAGYRLTRDLEAGDNGAIEADLGLKWRVPQGSLTAYAIGLNSGHAAKAEMTIDAVPVDEPFKPLPSRDSTADRLYFPQTGHTLAYGFKQFWQANGGVAVFGYPISEEFSEKNPDTGETYTVQYFERNRFEYHPELAGTPWEVSLGRLGVQDAPQVFPTAPPVNVNGVRYFAETQHTLSGSFRDFWQANGGVAVFGFPISEPFEQGGLLVQYFERSRFEYHPDLPSGSRVLLTRLGTTLARENGYLH
ncbi:MAG TPA: S8 family serine peptidase [Nitrolancea sp.]